MSFIKQNLLFIIGAVIVLGGLFYYFTNSNSGSGALLTSSTSSGTSPATQQLLTSLSNLHTITLDNSVFSDPVFVSLTDFGVQIAPENVGRGNPFAPFGTVITKSAH